MVSTGRILAKRNAFSQNQWGQWSHSDDFIEEGRLVSIAKLYQMNNGKMENVVIRRFSTIIDKEGNVIWEFMWGAPKLDIKITKVMCALRLQDDVIENDEIKASF